MMKRCIDDNVSYSPSLHQTSGKIAVAGLLWRDLAILGFRAISNQKNPCPVLEDLFGQDGRYWINDRAIS